MTSRDRRAIILGIAALTGAFVVWLVVLPGIDNWLETRQTIAKSQQRLAEVQEKTQRLAAMDRQLDAVFGAGQNKPLVNVDASQAQLISSLMDLHMRSGIQVRSVQPEAQRPIKDLPGVVRIAAEVQCLCQPLQLVNLLAAARTSSSLLLVDRLESSSNPQGPGMLNVTMVWSTLARQEKMR